MTRRKRKPWDSVPYTHQAFRPYVIALGQIALAWNGLHSSMALLFCDLMGGGFSNQFLGVWHAVPNDRTQRAVLLAAAENLADRTSDEQRARLVEAVKWIGQRADAVEEARNNALHSPLWGYRRGPDKTIVMPIVGLGHSRAVKLMAAKDLLAEFRWCRDAALVLENYVKALDEFFAGRTHSWPERPSLPNRGEAKAKPPNSRAKVRR